MITFKNKKELADIVENYIAENNVGPALSERAWVEIVTALRSEKQPTKPCCLTGYPVETPCSTHCSPALRDAVLEEAAQACHRPKEYLGDVSSTRAQAWAECEAAIRALKNAAPQVSSGAGLDQRTGSKPSDGGPALEASARAAFISSSPNGTEVLVQVATQLRTQLAQCISVLAGQDLTRPEVMVEESRNVMRESYETLRCHERNSE